MVEKQVEEKRIKSTVIRRRKSEAPVTTADAESTPAPVEATPAEAVEQQAALSATSTSTPPQNPAAPLLTVSPAGLGITGKTINLEGLVSGRGVKSAPAAKTAEVKPAGVSPAGALPETEIEEEEEGGKDKKGKVRKAVKRKEPDKLDVKLDGLGRIGSLTQLTRIATVDRLERVFEPSRLGRRKKVLPRKSQSKPLLTMSKAIKRIVEMGKTVSVGDLAKGMGVKVGDVIKKLMSMGTMATANQVIDFDTASLIAQEFHYEVKDVSFNEQKMLAQQDKGTSEETLPRPPVVTIMGHVDHGKTSLLDAIRQSKVVEGEAGGITQHIGAYTVDLPKGQITFLDTPGHEAFTAMRARGAAVTDIVIIVVAADEGMMPQTRESIDHAKAAKVPIVVAVNKIDKPEANIERIKRQMSESGLVPEEWGGDTLYTLVSAKQHTGIDDLLENLLLQAEVLALKANPHVKARGVVLEARLDKSRGPVSTVLVQQGTLHVGDIIVAGQYAGKVRAMVDHLGRPTNDSPPSHAVEIIGLEGVPMASDLFNVTADDQTAREIAQNRADEKRQAQAVAAKPTLEDFFARSQAGELPELNVVLKTDVQGSLEAVSEALRKIPSEKVKLKIIHGSVGGISESDILLASASKAIVLGFNVRPETKALSVAKGEGVDVKLYKIIYDMVNEVKLAMQGLLAPKKIETYLGRAEVRNTFTVSKVGMVAGCMVVDGKILRNAHLRLLRDNVVLYEGKVSSLKRFKDDVRDVAQGFECGLGIEGYHDIKPGDLIEAFEVELAQAEL